MKIKFVILLAVAWFVTANNKTLAQNSIPVAMDSCFMYVNLSSCSTNVLINKGFPTSNPTYFNGNLSTCQPANFNDWWDMYKCMLVGKTPASTWNLPSREQLLQNITTFETSLLNSLTTPNAATGEVAKLGLIYADYDYIVPNQSGTPYYTQNSLQQLIDNPNRTAHPYARDLLVATVSSLKESETGCIMFMLASNLYMSNKTAISNVSISVDFTSSGSYTSLSPDVPYQYSYGSTGLKTLTMKIVDGSNTYYAKTTIDVKNIYSPNNSFLGKTLCPTPCFDAIWRDWQNQNNSNTRITDAAGYIIFVRPIPRRQEVL